MTSARHFDNGKLFDVPNVSSACDLKPDPSAFSVLLCAVDNLQHGTRQVGSVGCLYSLLTQRKRC